MGLIKEYIIPRIFTYICTIFLGLTFSFFIPRFASSDPILEMITRLQKYGSYMDPDEIEKLRDTLMELYGFKGSLIEQYVAFWARLFKGDFGPSLSMFPAPVSEIIFNSLPWTLGLLTLSTITSWVLGNVIGAIAGYFREKKWSHALASFAIVVYPIPYYIMSLILVILFTYVFPIFPLFGGKSIGMKPVLSLEFILDWLYHSFLPSLSLVIVGYGWWFISMRQIVVNTRSEDYVTFGEAAGLSRRKLLTKYVMRNSMLVQVTGLSVSLGNIFSGTLITEMVFAYPGIGSVLYLAVTRADFNLMMGVAVYSIVAVATSILILDLIYPLIDPRIRYR